MGGSKYKKEKYYKEEVKLTQRAPQALAPRNGLLEPLVVAPSSQVVMNSLHLNLKALVLSGQCIEKEETSLMNP